MYDAPLRSTCAQTVNANTAMDAGKARRKTILGSRSAGSLEPAQLPATPVPPQETGAPEEGAKEGTDSQAEYVEEEQDGFRYKRLKREPGVCHARDCGHFAAITSFGVWCDGARGATLDGGTGPAQSSGRFRCGTTEAQLKPCAGRRLVLLQGTACRSILCGTAHSRAGRVRQ